MHEIGIRILIRKVQLIGAQYDKALIPIFSYSRDHYFRIFFMSIPGKKPVDEMLKQHAWLAYSAKTLGYAFVDTKGLEEECLHSRSLMPPVDEQAGRKGLFGPMWSGRLWSSSLLEGFSELFVFSRKDQSFIDMLKGEAELEAKIGPSLFFDIHSLYRKHDLGNVRSTEDIMADLGRQGFKVVRSHFSRYGIRTDANAEEIIGILQRNK